MKNAIVVLTAVLTCFGMTLSAADNTFLDYQNYNHGYCPDCNCAPCQCDACAPAPSPCNTCDPCEPYAPVCGTSCGVSLCAIGIGVVAVAAAAAILIASSNGSSSEHS